LVYYIIGQSYAKPCLYNRLMMEFPVLKISKKPQANFFLVHNTKLVLESAKHTIWSICVSSKWLMMHIVLSITSLESLYVYNSRIKILVMVTYGLPQMIQY